jgi:hypothetical protein
MKNLDEPARNWMVFHDLTKIHPFTNSCVGAVPVGSCGKWAPYTIHQFRLSGWSAGGGQVGGSGSW